MHIGDYNILAKKIAKVLIRKIFFFIKVGQRLLFLTKILNSN